MYLGKVIGTVVSTSKDPSLVGQKLLIVSKFDENMEMTSYTEVTVDTVGAGSGETVIVAKGSNTRHAMDGKLTPIDAAIVGIVDSIEVDLRK